jgi:hypothetical protein
MRVRRRNVDGRIGDRERQNLIPSRQLLGDLLKRLRRRL